MSKVTKYILGFIAIFIAAVICVFGIVKYEEKIETSINNSENLGSVDGKKLSKESLVIIEKISSINDLDMLKSELNLSDSTINILKKYAPTISYAIDNSNENDRIYIRHGGYFSSEGGYSIADNRRIDENEIIGAYEVKDGKLTSLNTNISQLLLKIKEDNLKWTNLNIKNTEHNIDVAEEIATKYFRSMSNRGLSAPTVFGYLSDSDKRITPSPQDGRNITSIIHAPLAEIVDIYNTRYKEVYTEDRVRKEVANYDNTVYREIDDSYTGNENKYNELVAFGELIYFKKDKMYLIGMGGIGGAIPAELSPKDRWIIEGDKITIPIVSHGNALAMEPMVLRLNNKNYEGGQSQSKYYIESM